MAERILMNELRNLNKEKWVNVELDNEDVFNWNVVLMILNPDSLYHGGYFKAKMAFPKNYPYSPPDFKFTRPLFHPNIYKDGKLCISILHPPGEDEMSGELAAERWSPAQRVESVLLSIISLLDDAECSSPANVDAAVMLRKDRAEYKKMVAKDVEKSKEDIPEGFVMPTSEIPARPPDKLFNEGDDFWYDSDIGDDFGGSDTEPLADEDEDEEMDEAEDEEDVENEEEDEEMDIDGKAGK